MIGQKVLASVVLVSVFVSGAVAGIFFDRHHALSGSGSLSPAELHDAAMAEIQDVLQLDDQQLERIHAILADRQEQVQRVWEQLRPRVHEAMANVHEEIAAVLTPEQRELYHRWIDEQRRHLEAESGVIVIPH